MDRGASAAAPQIPARPSIFDHSEALPYFHGRLTNTEEDRIFKYYLDTRGAFLLRKSNSRPDILVISIVVDRKNIFHIQVEQKHGRVSILQSNESFSSLERLINYFHNHPFPGTKHKDLYLTKAIFTKKSLSKPSVTPSVSPVRGRPPMLMSEQKKKSIDERPQLALPKPTENPIYAAYSHIYSRVDKVEADQLELILQLCGEVDREMSNASRMKCSCGLYQEESVLVDGWMMHRDIEGETTRGRIFFLDTRTNLSMWRLPPEVEVDIRTNYPEKWKLLCRLTREPTSNYDL